MRELVDDVLKIDWEQVRFGRAASGLVSMLIVVGFLGSLGDPVLAALFATLFTTASGGDGSMSERLPGMTRFTLAGAILGGLAWWSAESAVAVALVLGVATYLGTLAAAEVPQAAKAGLYLTLWPLFALLLGTGDSEPWVVAAGFMVGGTISIAITALRLAMAEEDPAEELDGPDPADGVRESSWMQRLVSAARTPIGIFAALRTGAVVAAVVIGANLFDTYPLWVAITVIVVVKPSPTQSLSTAVQRTLGTAAGVAIAILLSQVLPRNDWAVAFAFLASGVLMLAFNNANYTLFATFLTAMLVFGQRLVEADAFEAGWSRLFATLVGVGIAIGVMYLANLIDIRRGHGETQIVDPSTSR